MFVVNDDLSIYATRGDIVCLNVSALDDSTGNPYEFQPGDIVRMKIFVKKDAENVVMSKDFPVVAKTDSVGVFLTEQDTKIGDVISKPTDYWYEIELNPYTNPQTIVGYDEDGAKIFKLFPEGKDMVDEPTEPEDIPVVDKDLDLTSGRPVENKAISRAITLLKNDLAMVDERLTGKIKANKDTSKELNEALLVERARIDNLVSGATAEGSEIVDIRVGADGRTYDSAGMSVRSQVKSLSNMLGDIRTRISPSLIPPDIPVTKNAQIREDGTVGVSSAWASFVTDFFAIEDNGLAFRVTGDLGATIGFYDENRAFISKAEITGSKLTETPSGSVFARMQGWDDYIETRMFYQSAEELPYMEYHVYVMPYVDEKITEVRGEIRALQPQYEITNYMLFAGEIEENKCFDEYGQIVDDSDNSRSVTAMIPLRRDKNMYSNSEAWTEVAYYDATGAYIGKVKGLRYLNPCVKEDYPDNAEYVRFCYYHSNEYVHGEAFAVLVVDNEYNSYTYGRIKKVIGQRPIINIYTKDTEEEIYLKLMDAWYVQDCDVYWEKGKYHFSDIYRIMAEKYRVRDYLELPVGQNCRYYFNNSVITGVKSDRSETQSLFSSTSRSGASSYELHDGTLIGKGLQYVVHDEGSSKTEPYIHLYNNIRMHYVSDGSTLDYRKCIGGGTGMNGQVIIENCVFESDNAPDVSYHGHYNDNDTESVFYLTVTNSYFANRLSLDQMGANETGVLIYNGNSSGMPVSDSAGAWDKKMWLNEVR